MDASRFEALNVILGIMGPMGIAGLFLYVRGIKSDVGETRCDVREVAKDLKEFKNGHYTQHMADSYERGIKDSKLDALHTRLDRISGRQDRIETDRR